MRYRKDPQATYLELNKCVSGRKAFIGRVPAGLCLITMMVILSGSAVLGTGNRLANSGYESGTFPPWTTLGSAVVESTNAHYYNGGNPGGSNVLTHSGVYAGKSYGQFNAQPNYNGCFQEIAAAAGSVWSAGGYALSHEQDLIGPGNQFWLEVSFLDATNGLVGRFRSYMMDPFSAEGVTSNVWYSLAVTNEVDIGDPNFGVTNTVASFTAPAGTAKVRHQVVFYQPSFSGGSVYYDDLDLTEITASDPDITSGPSGTNVFTPGKTVSFSVAATGLSTLHYQWMKNGVNMTNLTGKFVGAQSATFFVINCVESDAGDYSVLVTDTAASITSLPATMTVNLDPVAAANFIVNPGFEDGINSWIGFNGFAINTTNDTYAGTSTPIKTHSGGKCLLVYPSGYSGAFQDKACTPGSIWKAACWMLSTTNELDSWVGDGSGAVWMEAGFHASQGDSVFLALYRSDFISATSSYPRDVYTSMLVTNIWDPSDAHTNIIGSSAVLIAPPGANNIRAQITRNPTGAGNIWVDDVTLFQLLPLQLSVSNNAASVYISFASQAGWNHDVYATTNLSGGTWQLLTTVVGDATRKTVADPISGNRRYYRVGSR